MNSFMVAKYRKIIEKDDRDTQTVFTDTIYFPRSLLSFQLNKINTNISSFDLKLP